MSIFSAKTRSIQAAHAEQQACAQCRISAAGCRYDAAHTPGLCSIHCCRKRRIIGFDTIMLSFERIETACLNDDTTPWISMYRDQPGIEIKYFRIDPVRGEVLCSLRMQAGMQLPAHHHTGTVIVYTLQGSWKYQEHDWIARAGSVVFETAASRHTPETLPDSEVVHTFNVVSGELLFLDADDKLIATENWRTALHRYLKHCERNQLTPLDLSGFGALPPA